MTAPETIRRSEFYVIGGTLRRDAPSYVVREADQQLYAALCQGQVCYALTPRQMGKSSLMVRTATRLRDTQTSVAILDLTALGQNLTAEQWYNGLLGRVGQQLDLEDHLESYWNDHTHLGPLQRWTGAIREVLLESCSGRVVIFIDEIDAVRSLPFSTDEFFAGIREAFNRRPQDTEFNRLTFCLLGVATPSDLIRDTRTTPFNIGLRIELSDFSAEEAAPLAQGLSDDCEKGRQILRRILYWTGGHPYLTQRLCQAVSEHQVSSMATVDEVCGELFLSNRARERDDNLLFVRERMLRNETDVAGLLLLYGKVRKGGKVRDEETNPLVTVLRLAGIVCAQSGYLIVRNRIYAEVFDTAWVSANLPGAELRRQRTAYVRGLTIAAGVFVPMFLIGAGYGIYREFRVTPPSGIDQSLKPPVFWASFASQTLPTSSIGALLISAGDAGVSVFVSGEQFGRTEKDGTLQIPYLPAQDYDVRLEKPGYQTISQRVQIVPQHETRLMSKLSPITFASYMLVIDQAPAGADVKIDGTPRGTTDVDGKFSIKITPGEHAIELQREGYVAKSFRQALRPGENRINGHLEVDQALADWIRASSSEDVPAIEAFLTRYPNSRFEGQARARKEQLEWNKYQECNDPVLLQGFIDRYPHGQHIDQARALAARLQREDLEWRDANTPTALRAFLDRYPHSRHVDSAQTALGIFEDQANIRELLKEYQDAYNHQNLKQLGQLWPNCPAELLAALNSSFREKRSGTLVLLANGDPQVTGNIATLQVSRTRQTNAASTTGNVPFKFRKQNDHWFIENGSF